MTSSLLNVTCTCWRFSDHESAVAFAINVVWVEWSFDYGRSWMNDFGNLGHLVFFKDVISFGCHLEILDAHCKLPSDTLDFDMVDVNLFSSLSLQKKFPPSPQDLHLAQIS